MKYGRNLYISIILLSVPFCLSSQFLTQPEIESASPLEKGVWVWILIFLVLQNSIATVALLFVRRKVTLVEPEAFSLFWLAMYNGKGIFISSLFGFTGLFFTVMSMFIGTGIQALLCACIFGGLGSLYVLLFTLYAHIKLL